MSGEFLRGLQDVVAVMAERDLGGAKLGRHPIKNATAQSRAQRAHRAAVGNNALDDAVGILLLDVKGDAAPGEVERRLTADAAASASSIKDSLSESALISSSIVG